MTVLRGLRDKQASEELLEARRHLELALALIDREDRETKSDLRWVLNRVAHLVRVLAPK